MIKAEDIDGLIGSTVMDEGGDKIGTVGQVDVDPDTGRPNWVTVRPVSSLGCSPVWDGDNP